MAVTRGSKTWWIVHVAAGVAAVALLAFGMTQCNGKKSERTEKQQKQSELLDASRKMERAVGQIDSLLHDNRAKADTIRMQRDSIIVLNDSLAVVNDKLADCRKAKKPCPQPKKPCPQPKKPCPQPKKPVKKTVAPNPVVKPQPVVKPDTIVVMVQAPADTVKCAPAVNVNLNNSQNNGVITVGKNNAGADVRLENGAVNNGAIVIGNGNNVVVNNPTANVVAADTLVRVTKIRRVIVNCEIQKTY